MILAYRHGLLKPDYKYGIQSQIRERLVLSMMNAEVVADEISEARNVMYTAVAPALDPKKLSDVQEDIINSCKRSSGLREYNIHQSRDDQRKRAILLQSSRGMVQAFMELQRRGIIKKIEDRLKERNAEQ